MTKFPVLFAVVTLTFGVAQASTLYTNTFDLGQVLSGGGPGPMAPLTPFTLGGVTPTVDALGVTFDFAEGPSFGTAIYGDSGPLAVPAPGTPAAFNDFGDNVSYTGPISEPLLDGAADGTLTLNFDYPTNTLAFDIFYVLEPGDSGGTVTLGGAGGTTLATDTFTTTGDGIAFSIGRFDSTAITSSPITSPITTAKITFTDPNASFGIDNLQFDTPEPSSLMLLAAGALLLGAVLRVRRFPLRASNSL
jgi:hypothetical protein